MLGSGHVRAPRRISSCARFVAWWLTRRTLVPRRPTDPVQLRCARGWHVRDHPGEGQGRVCREQAGRHCGAVRDAAAGSCAALCALTGALGMLQHQDAGRGRGGRRSRLHRGHHAAVGAVALRGFLQGRQRLVAERDHAVRCGQARSRGVTAARQRLTRIRSLSVSLQRACTCWAGSQAPPSPCACP